jgi:hypothetical protein
MAHNIIYDGWRKNNRIHGRVCKKTLLTPGFAANEETARVSVTAHDSEVLAKTMQEIWKTDIWLMECYE